MWGSCALTSPLPTSSSAVALAPKNISMVKARSLEQTATTKFVSCLTVMSTTPGLVTSAYPRLIQCLVDTTVSFYCLSGGVADATAVHGDLWRFLVDSISHSSCPSRLLVSLREAEQTFASSPVAVSSSSPEYREHLIRHLIVQLLHELLPAFECSPEVSFTNSTPLRENVTILDYVWSVRDAASTHGISSHVARMRIFTQIQDAADVSNPAVHNAVVNMILPMVQQGMELSSFASELRTHVELGGYLKKPIIPAVTEPPAPPVLTAHCLSDLFPEDHRQPDDLFPEDCGQPDDLFPEG